MRWLVLALLGSSLFVVGVSGCGGGGATSCSTTFAACGGDLTGTWHYQTTCNQGSFMSSQCPAATGNISANISGTVTFNADKTYATDLTVAETGTESIPASCLGGGVLTSCSQLDQNNTSAGLTIKTTCTGDITKSCDCTLSLSGTVNTTGTYLTAGNAVTLTPKGGTAGNPSSYCVAGSQLELGSTFMGSAAANSYALFTK